MKRKNETRQGKGFTLVELLVVVAIIALLVSILLPTLSRAKELTKRTICATNLSGIGKSFAIYANDFNDRLPGNGNDTSHHWRAIGYHRSSATSDDYGDDWSNSRNLWIAVMKSYVNSNMFVCPSVGGQVSELASGGTTYYDFADHNGLSYSYQVQRAGVGESYSTSFSDNSGLVIMADRNATIEKGWTDYAAGGEYASYDNSKKTENSANHGSDRDGQNVLFLSTSVKWTKTPRVGVGNDNIWTASDDPDSDGDDLNGVNYPRTREDSFLAP